MAYSTRMVRIMPEPPDDIINPIIHFYPIDKSLSDTLRDVKRKRRRITASSGGTCVVPSNPKQIQYPQIFEYWHNYYHPDTAQIMIIFPFHDSVGILNLTGNEASFNPKVFIYACTNTMELPPNMTDPKEQLKNYVQQIMKPRAFERVWKDIKAELDAQLSEQSAPTSVDNS